MSISELFLKFRYYQASDLGRCLPEELNTELGLLLFTDIDFEYTFLKLINDILRKRRDKLYWDEDAVQAFNDIITIAIHNDEYLERTIIFLLYQERDLNFVFLMDNEHLIKFSNNFLQIEEKIRSMVYHGAIISIMRDIYKELIISQDDNEEEHNQLKVIISKFKELINQ